MVYLFGIDEAWKMLEGEEETFVREFLIQVIRRIRCDAERLKLLELKLNFWTKVDVSNTENEQKPFLGDLFDFWRRQIDKIATIILMIFLTCNFNT